MCLYVFLQLFWASQVLWLKSSFWNLDGKNELDYQECSPGKDKLLY